MRLERKSGIFQGAFVHKVKKSKFILEIMKIHHDIEGGQKIDGEQ